MEDFIRKLEEYKAFGDTFTIYVGRNEIEWHVQLESINREKMQATFKTDVGRRTFNLTFFWF